MFKVISVVVFTCVSVQYEIKMKQSSRECVVYSLYNMVAEVKTIHN